MVTLKQALTSVAAAAVLCVGLASAQGITGLGGPPAPPPAAPGDVQVQMLINGEDNYAVGGPIGWHAVTGEGADYVFIAPDGSALCIVDGSATDVVFTNDEARQAMATNLGEQFWDGNLFGTLPDKKYIRTGADTAHPSGWPFQIAELTGTIDGQPRNIAAMITFRSKKIYILLCNSAAQNYEANKPAINAVLKSIKFSGE